MQTMTMMQQRESGLLSGSGNVFAGHSAGEVPALSAAPGLVLPAHTVAYFDAELISKKEDGAMLRRWDDHSESGTWLYRLDGLQPSPWWRAKAMDGRAAVCFEEVEQDMRPPESGTFWQNGENSTVLYIQTQSTGQTLITQGEPHGDFVRFQISENGKLGVVRRQDVFVESQAPVADGRPHLVRVHVASDGTWRIYVDGTLSGQAQSSTFHYQDRAFSSFRLGRGAFCMGLLLIAHGPVTRADMNRIAEYVGAEASSASSESMSWWWLIAVLAGAVGYKAYRQRKEEEDKASKAK